MSQPRSHDVTTQRIVLRREILRQPAASPVAANLLDTYGYQAVDTCAGDGACKLACPVGIDTGALMKQFRAARHTSFSERIALTAANRFGAAERGARTVLRLATAVGDRPMGTATRLLRRISNPELIPEWLPELPGAARPLPDTSGTARPAASTSLPASIGFSMDHSRVRHHFRRRLWHSLNELTFRS